MHSHEPLDHLAYSNRWSLRHPGEKVLLAIGLLTLEMALPVFPIALIVLLVTSALACWGAGIPVRSWLKTLASHTTFLAIATFPVAWQSGLEFSTQVLMRSVAATSCLMLLALTTPLPSLFGWMGQWQALRPIIDLAAMLYRFIALGLNCVSQGRAAMRQRVGPVGRRHGWPLLSQVSGRVLNRLLHRSLRMEQGFKCRGIDGLIPLLDTRPPVDHRFVMGSLLLLAVLSATGAARW